MAIKSVNIIGSGNVAHYLIHALSQHVRIQTIYSKDFNRAKTLAEIAKSIPVNDLGLLNSGSDLNIVCVKDDSIENTLKQLSKLSSVVLTSGAIEMDVMSEFKTHGILYPLQSISKDRIAKLKDVPFLIEANSSEFESELLQFSNYFSVKSIVVNSSIRKRIHLSAVFANNFSNFFLTEAKRILDDAGVDFKILQPLMIETIAKAFELGPEKSQTGPAKRGDQKTITLHERLLMNEKLKDLYLLITELIQEQSNEAK